jgi:hypothetical protein
MADVLALVRHLLHIALGEAVADELQFRSSACTMSGSTASALQLMFITPGIPNSIRPPDSRALTTVGMTGDRLTLARDALLGVGQVAPGTRVPRQVSARWRFRAKPKNLLGRAGRKIRNRRMNSLLNRRMNGPRDQQISRLSAMRIPARVNVDLT